MVWPPKKWSSLVFLQTLDSIFQSQTTLGAIFAQIFGDFPRHLGILFGFSGILPKFSEILLKFSEILHGFSTNPSFWGCACTPAPRLLHYWDRPSVQVTMKTATRASQHGRNFVVKCGGDSLVWNQYILRIDAEVTFYTYRFPILFLEVFWQQHESRFILADDLHINILEFVAGHGAVVQPASINIVFGCKQAQQYSRTHQLGFIRTVSWIAQNAESHWSHVHIALAVEHFSFHAFYKKYGLQRDLMSCSSRLTLQRR